MCPCRTLGQFPFVVEEVGEEVVAPTGRRCRPDDFQAAADRVGAETFAKFILPPEPLIFDIGAFRFISYIVRRNPSTMRFAERVSTGDERDSLFVVHRHASERLA